MRKLRCTLWFTICYFHRLAPRPDAPTLFPPFFFFFFHLSSNNTLPSCPGCLLAHSYFYCPCSSQTPHKPRDRYTDFISPVMCRLVAVCSTCYLNMNLDLGLLAVRFQPTNNKIIRFICIWSQLLLLSRIGLNIKATS